MRLAAILLVASSLYGQGTPITTQTWTRVPLSGWPCSVVGFEKSAYIPDLNASVFLGTYHEGGNEPNQGLCAVSIAEARMWVLQDGGTYHDSYQSTAGHSVGQIAWIPAPYNLLYLMDGGSGSNTPERPNRTFLLDVLSGSMHDKYTGVSPNYIPSNASSTLNTDVWDSQNNVLISYPDITGALVKYDPATNLYSRPTVSGTCPTPGGGGGFFSSTFNSTDHKVYYYGGVTTTIYAYDAATDTCSSPTLHDDPVHGHPVAREREGWAYSSVDNVILMTSGQDGSSTVLQDTWAWHPSTGFWEWLSTTSGYYDGTTPNMSFERLVHHITDNAFVMMMPSKTGQTDSCTGGTSNCATAWVFCYSTCLNAGRTSSTYTPTAGYLNTKFTGTSTLPNGQLDEGSTQSTSFAVDSSNGDILAAWIESGTAFDAVSGEGRRHPYIAKSTNSGASWSLLGGAWNSLDTSNTESDNLHLAVASGVPWVSWSTGPDSSLNSQLSIASYSSGSWHRTDIASRGGSGYFRGPNSITMVGTAPYVASIESREITTAAALYVDTCPAGTCSTVGGALNFNSSAVVSRALATSITSDGSNPYPCWIEETVDANSSYYPVTLTPQVYCAYYSSGWTQISAGSLNKNPADWAQAEVATTYFGGHLYVAWPERTTAGNPKLYVKQCTNSTCTLIGDGINLFAPNGWPMHPSLANDGSTLYGCWEEQSDLGNAQQIYCKSWNGTAWSQIGGSLNMNPSGFPAFNSLAMVAGKPAVLWTEMLAGNLRQVYLKRWTGTQWSTNLGANNGGGAITGGKSVRGGKGSEE